MALYLKQWIFTGVFYKILQVCQYLCDIFTYYSFCLECRLYILNNHLLHFGSLPKINGFSRGYFIKYYWFVNIFATSLLTIVFALNVVLHLKELFVTFGLCFKTMDFNCEFYLLSLFYGQLVLVYLKKSLD